jgi:hypothetical protein
LTFQQLQEDATLVKKPSVTLSRAIVFRQYLNFGGLHPFIKDRLQHFSFQRRQQR